MAEGNGSAPKMRLGKVHSAVHCLKVAVWAGWGWGKVLIDRLQTLKRGLTIFRHRYMLSLFWGCSILLAWYIPRRFPEWHLRITVFIWENLLFVCSLFVMLLFLLLWKVPKRQVAGIADEKDRLTAESGFRQTLIQITGGAALLGGLYFTAQTLRTSQETLQVNQETLRTTQAGQFTERFNKAVEYLGNKEQLMVRVGGIYALERIAKDSEYDHWTVMEVLTAFVREQTQVQKITPTKSLKANMKSQVQESSKPPADIQAILTVLGRRTRRYEHEVWQMLNLRRSHLGLAAASKPKPTVRALR